MLRLAVGIELFRLLFEFNRGLRADLSRRRLYISWSLSAHLSWSVAS